MTEVHWVVEDNLAIENKHSFKDVCENFHELEYVPFTSDETSKVKGFKKDSKDCVVAYGGVATIQKIQRLYPNWQPNSYANYDAFNTMNYYEHYYDYLLNQDFVIRRWDSFASNMDDFKGLFEEFSVEDLFMRPVKGSKTFTGKAFEKSDSGFQALNQEQLYEFPQDELILVAPAINLLKEWRLVVVNHEVVSGCLYKDKFVHEEKEGFPNEVKEFAEAIIKDIGYNYWFDAAYVMDICERKNGDLRLIECNAFSSAGMYACDLKPIVEAIEYAASCDWDDAYGNKI